VDHPFHLNRQITVGRRRTNGEGFEESAGSFHEHSFRIFIFLCARLTKPKGQRSKGVRKRLNAALNASDAALETDLRI
jgi:hypothetical protein